MKSIWMLMAILLIGAAQTVAAQTGATQGEFATYQEMRDYFGRLYQEQKYEKAAEVLEAAIDKFPDHLLANSFNLAIIYGHLNRLEEGVRVLENALAEGIFFNKWAFDHEIWSPYKELDAFESVLGGNEKARQEAQKQAKPDLLVITPVDYQEGHDYPLFIALHGGGGNIAGFKDRWVSDRLKNEFIVAFVQSSQVVSMTGFSWTEDVELAKKEIAEAYSEVVAEYPVERGRVIVGGFSSGGVAALEVAFSDVVPVTGFVALCPARPEGMTSDIVEKGRDRGLRGTLLTTEMDPRLDKQKEMIEMFKAAGLEHRFVVTPNIGHWFPEDLDRQIDESIDHITSKW